MRTRCVHTALTVLAALVVAVLGGACGGDDSGSGDAGSPGALPGEGKPPVTIGTKDFPEQFILGELYAQALEAAGLHGQPEEEHRTDRGGRRRADGRRDRRLSGVPRRCGDGGGGRSRSLSERSRDLPPRAGVLRGPWPDDLRADAVLQRRRDRDDHRVRRGEPARHGRRPERARARHPRCSARVRGPVPGPARDARSLRAPRTSSSSSSRRASPTTRSTTAASRPSTCSRPTRSSPRGSTPF